MTKDKQQIAIAEIHGWTKCRLVIRGAGAPEREPSAHGFPPGRAYEAPCPSYLNDLNAIHAVVKEYWDNQAFRQLFYGYLIAMTSGKLGQAFDPSQEELRNVLMATAAQWAESFLRTSGKWED